MENYKHSSSILITLFLLTSIYPFLASAGGPTSFFKPEDQQFNQTHQADLITDHSKLIAVVTILLASALGVCIQVIDNKTVIPAALRPDGNIFFLVKAFAAGALFATGFIHIFLPSLVDLTPDPWSAFPLSVFIASVSAMFTIMADSFFSMILLSSEDDTDLRRREIIFTRVMKSFVAVQSVIIGIAVGVSSDPSRIKHLVTALTFHQFFQGMRLGKFKVRKAAGWMDVCNIFAMPIGIGIGLAIAKSCSATGLILQGSMCAAAAGILVSMALVDLLAPVFTDDRKYSNLHLAAFVSLFLGSGFTLVGHCLLGLVTTIFVFFCFLTRTQKDLKIKIQ